MSDAVTIREMMNALDAAAEAEERTGQFGPFEQLSVELGEAMTEADNVTVQATEAARLFESDHLLTWRNILDSLTSGSHGAGDNYRREDILSARDALQQLGRLYHLAGESADKVLRTVDATIAALREAGKL